MHTLLFPLTLIALLLVPMPLAAQSDGPVIYPSYRTVDRIQSSTSLERICIAAQPLADMPTRYPEVDDLLRELSDACGFVWEPRDWRLPEQRCDEAMCMEDELPYVPYRQIRWRKPQCAEDEILVNVTCTTSHPFSCQWQCFKRG